MISLHIEADNTVDLFKQLRAIVQGDGAQTVSAGPDKAGPVVIKPEAEKNTGTSTADKLIAKGKEITGADAKKSEKQTDAKAPADAQGSKDADKKGSAGTTGDVIEYKVVGDAINLAAKTKKDEVVALLAKYEAKRGTELKPEQYAPFLAELQELA